MPILFRSGRLTVAAAVVSVRPYPCSTVTPAPRKKWHEPLAQRGAAGDGVTAPGRRARPAAWRRPAGRTARAGPAGRTRARPARPAPGCRRSRSRAARPKIGALPLADRLLLGAVVDLLEHPRHREDERGPEGGQRGQQRVQVPAVPEHDPGLDAAHLDDPGEDVRERQEQQRAGVLGPGEVHQRAEERVAHGGEQVLVGELAALGPPGGARGVDDGGQVGRLGRGGALGDRPRPRPRRPPSRSEFAAPVPAARSARCARAPGPAPGTRR